MRRAGWWQLAPLPLLLLVAALARTCGAANENTHWMAGEWAQVDYSIYHTKCAPSLAQCGSCSCRIWRSLVSQYCLETRFWPKQPCSCLPSCTGSGVQRLQTGSWYGRDQVFEEVEQVVAANQKIMRVRASWRDAIGFGGRPCKCTVAQFVQSLCRS